MSNAGGQSGATTILSKLPEKLVAALPPAMTLLIVLNVIFLGVSTYVFSHNSDKRAELLTKIIDRCLNEQNRP